MKTSKWDMAEFIDTKGDVIADDLGVSREGLYKSLTPGSNPAFGTVVKTLDNLGFKLNIELKSAS